MYVQKKSQISDNKQSPAEVEEEDTSHTAQLVTYRRSHKDYTQIRLHMALGCDNDMGCVRRGCILSYQNHDPLLLVPEVWIPRYDRLQHLDDTWPPPVLAVAVFQKTSTPKTTARIAMKV